MTEAFLKEERDDIGPIDSLRKVREVFNCIKMSYRQTQQNVGAIRRQIEANPDAFKKKASTAVAEPEASRLNSAAGEEKKDDNKSVKMLDDKSQISQEDRS